MIAIIPESVIGMPRNTDRHRPESPTIREYVKRREIRGKIIGKRWRFRRADLDTFFENAPSEWDFDRE